MCITILFNKDKIGHWKKTYNNAHRMEFMYMYSKFVLKSLKTGRCKKKPQKTKNQDPKLFIGLMVVFLQSAYKYNMVNSYIRWFIKRWHLHSKSVSDRHLHMVIKSRHINVQLRRLFWWHSLITGERYPN